jgi:hypothetical protein
LGKGSSRPGIAAETTEFGGVLGRADPFPNRLLQQDSNPLRYNLCPTAPDDSETPNVAAQFLVFALSYFTSMGGQGRALVYPEEIKPRKKLAFELVMPPSSNHAPSN